MFSQNVVLLFRRRLTWNTQGCIRYFLLRLIMQETIKWHENLSCMIMYQRWVKHSKH